MERPAALLVRTLAERLDRQTSDANASLLTTWWRSRDDQTSHSAQYFSQTLRLAYLYLCVRLANVPPVAELEAEIYNSLMTRQFARGLWGDWWVTSELRDSTPRLFTSAIVLLSCGLLGGGIDDERLVEAAPSLEHGILNRSDVPSAYIAAAAAALSCTAGHQTSRNFSRLATSVARNSPWRVVDQFTYFYEFRGARGDTQEYGRGLFYCSTIAFACHCWVPALVAARLATR